MIKIRLRYIALSFLLPAVLMFCSISTATAQSQFAGQVFENKTTIPVAGITVENLGTHLKTASAKDGTFIITAKIGDLLLFSSQFYEPDTVLITNRQFLKISLQARNTNLKEVKVESQEATLRNSVYHSPGLFNSQTVLYQTDAAGHPIGGIKIMLHDSHSGEKKRVHDEKIAVDEKNRETIAKLFSPENLKNYVPISGQELTNFSILYTPNLKVFTDASFNFLTYVTDCYKRFKEIPSDKRQSAELTRLPVTP